MVLHKQITIKFLSLIMLVVALVCMEYDFRFVSGERIRCKERERQALLRFKQGLIENGLLSSWGSEDGKKECCKWKGVECSDTNGHVTALVLYADWSSDGRSLKFGGTISSALLELHHLNHFDVSWNDFVGNKIPEFIGSIKSLEYLNLKRSNFSGGIPSQLGNLTNLRTLDLSYNQLTGSVPASLGQLSKLEQLVISFNSLGGKISEAHFMKLHNLKELSLSFNSLTLDLSPDWIPPFLLECIELASCKMGPSFPTWFQTQSNFYELDISVAGISDEVPNWFWDLSPKIYYLNLSHNQISGAIPDLSSHFIDELDVSANKFSGNVPLIHPNTSIARFNQNSFSGSISSICPVSDSKLMLLDLSNNQMAGALPDCWENMMRLIILNLNNNSLSGEIPHALGSLSNLNSLHLGGNDFSGELPSTLKNCQFLQSIDIGGNKLTGNIPPWLGENYANMMYMSLRQNRFYGGIPPEICKLTQIQMLDLSGNNISGKIPQCFNNFTSLIDMNRETTSTIFFQVGPSTYIEYAFVQWKGQESEYRNTLGLLKLIDLSSNKLVGNIPKTFSSLRGLVSLNLSRNNLTGNMDPKIGQMEMLECLDLSRNRLWGEIPSGLAQLHYLAVLDLANNNLSGKIPLSTQLQSFNESVYSGNGELCGRPLKLCQEDGLSPSITNEGENIKEKDKGFMSLSFTQEFGIAISFGFIVGFWGVVGSFVLKKSWRNAYFNFLDVIGDWLHVTTIIIFNKLGKSPICA